MTTSHARCPDHGYWNYEKTKKCPECGNVGEYDDSKRRPDNTARKKTGINSDLPETPMVIPKTAVRRILSESL